MQGQETKFEVVQRRLETGNETVSRMFKETLFLCYMHLFSKDSKCMKQVEKKILF